MATMQDRLREARIAAGFPTAAAAARALGLPYQTYAGHENGKTGFKHEAAERYARKFRVSLEWLITGRGEMRMAKASGLMTYEDAFGLPMLGVIRAGLWVDTTAVDEQPSYRIPVLPDERFQARQYGLLVEGTSMNKIFPDGTYVICADFAQIGLPLKPGMIAHIERRRDGGSLVEITLKQIERVGHKWRLNPMSMDPKWQPVTFDPDAEDQEIVIRGIAIGAYHRLIP